MEIRDGGGVSNGGEGHTRRITSFNITEERLFGERASRLGGEPVDLVIFFFLIRHDLGPGSS